MSFTSYGRFLADEQERTYPWLSAEYQDRKRCCRFFNLGFATWYVTLWINFLDDADVSRKGLRSFEVCWSEAQAAILEFCRACWLGFVCIHIWFLGMQ
jgi:hypothetical protein